MPTERVKIVVADDNEDIRETTAELLTTRGFDVHTVGDARAIRDTVERERPAILLQDIYMPGLDVTELVRSLHGKPETADTRIVLFTASVEGDDVVAEFGADDIVHKPYDVEFLARVLMRNSIRVKVG